MRGCLLSASRITSTRQSQSCESEPATAVGATHAMNCHATTTQLASRQAASGAAMLAATVHRASGVHTSSQSSTLSFKLSVLPLKSPPFYFFSVRVPHFFSDSSDEMARERDSRAQGERARRKRGSAAGLLWIGLIWSMPGCSGATSGSRVTVCVCGPRLALSA